MSDKPYPINTEKCAKTVAVIRGLLPVETNSIANFRPTQIRRDAADTRIIVHHKYPALVGAFLSHKREHGSDIEKALYGTPETWTWQQQVARLVEKRPLVFVNSNDHTMLRDGQMVGSLAEEWDRVGTDAEATNKYVTLQEYLSYDEMMLGSLLGASGPSFFINDGNRYNRARPGKPGTFEEHGIVVGLVGARFERNGRMDSVYMLPSAARARPGQRPVIEARQHQDLRNLFAGFFGTRMRDDRLFNHDMYKARMRITIDLLLLEANERARAASKRAYVHIVGLGLGVWQVNDEQPRIYLEGFMDALNEFGHKLQNIGTLDFAYIDVVRAAQKDVTSSAARHGISVVFSRRNPSEKLPPEKRDELLVASYAWDSNAFPGNEYWAGSLAASGDPAAACMSTIAELHNPILNPQFLEKIQVL